MIPHNIVMNLLDRHKMLSILAELMNKHGYQPMPVLMRAEPRGARQTSNSAKILHVVAILGGIFALIGAVVFCLAAFNAFPSGAVESKATGTSPLAMTQVYAAVPAGHENGLEALPADANQGRHETIADDPVAIYQPATPAPAESASSAPEPMTQASTSLNDNEFLKEDHPDSARTISISDRSISDRSMSEVKRKNLESQRRRAERQRAELEESYRDHAISGEAYKKGEEKYRSAIEKYRWEMNAGGGSKNEATGQN
jgi:hypothetical protein